MSNGRRVVVVTAAAGIGLAIARRSPPTAIGSLGKRQIGPGESRCRDTMRGECMLEPIEPRSWQPASLLSRKINK